MATRVGSSAVPVSSGQQPAPTSSAASAASAAASALLALQSTLQATATTPPDLQLGEQRYWASPRPKRLRPNEMDALSPFVHASSFSFPPPRLPDQCLISSAPGGRPHHGGGLDPRLPAPFPMPAPAQPQPVSCALEPWLPSCSRSPRPAIVGDASSAFTRPAWALPVSTGRGRGLLPDLRPLPTPFSNVQSQAQRPQASDGSLRRHAAAAQSPL